MKDQVQLKLSELRNFFPEYAGWSWKHIPRVESYELYEPAIQQLYDSVFTESELDTILTFLRTPAGQKLLEVDGVLFTQITDAGSRALVQELSDFVAEANAAIDTLIASGECETLRTGDFRYQTFRENTIHAVRTDTLQVDQTTWGEVEHKISWPNACTYILHTVSVSDPVYKWRVGERIEHQIIEVTDDYYRCARKVGPYDYMYVDILKIYSE